MAGNMKTEITLRPIRRGDEVAVREMFIAFNRSAFGKYDRIDDTGEAHVAAFLENMAQNHVIYAVTPAGSDEMIGYVCFHIEGDRYDIGYMISAQYQGAGIATAASQMAMETLKAERGANVFTATAAAENRPSVRVLEKLGFRLVSEICSRKKENGAEYEIHERRYVKRLSDPV